MNTSSSQVQLKVSLSQQLNELLQSKAARFGIPVTQFVKHLIIKEVEDLQYPTFKMSKRTEERAEEAIEEIDKAVDASDFFKQLNKG